MNYRAVLLMMMVFCCTLQPSYAGFIVNKNTLAATQAAAHNRSDNTSLVIKHPEVRQKGALGTLSLVFGICGFIPLVGAFFSVAAIILGSMGLRKKQKYSRAGLILGIGTITLGIIITIIIFASLGAL